MPLISTTQTRRLFINGPSSPPNFHFTASSPQHLLASRQHKNPLLVAPSHFHFQQHFQFYSTSNNHPSSFSSSEYKRKAYEEQFKSSAASNPSPSYTLPYANQSKLNIYLGVGLLLGLATGLIIRPYVEAILNGGSEQKKNALRSSDNGSGSLSPDFQTRIDALFEENVDSQTASGEPALTSMAFVKALIGPGMKLPDWAALPRDSQTNELLVKKNLKQSKFMRMVHLADLNHDQLITRDEFVFFWTLVSYTPRQFEIAFKLFDADDSGSVNFHEFSQIMGGALNQDAKYKSPVDLSRNGLVMQFFGPNLDQQLTYKRFNKFLINMKRDLLELEFMQHDFENEKMISVESFSELMTNSTHFNSMRVPFFKRQLNTLKTNGFFRPSGKIDFETFLTFSQIAEQLEDIECAIRILDVTKHPITRESFSQTLSKVCQISAPKRAVELIFTIFDNNGDGQLDHKEFLRTLRVRNRIEGERGEALSGSKEENIQQ